MRAPFALLLLVGCLGPPAPDRDRTGSAPADLPGAPQDEHPDAFAPVGGQRGGDDGGSGLGKDGWAKVEAQWRCLEGDDAAIVAQRRSALLRSYGVTADWLADTRAENARDADFARKVEQLVNERMAVDCPGGRLDAELAERIGE